MGCSGIENNQLEILTLVIYIHIIAATLSSFGKICTPVDMAVSIEDQEKDAQGQRSRSPEIGDRSPQPDPGALRPVEVEETTRRYAHQQLMLRVPEDGEVRISSSFNATKLWFNHKCPQFSAFVESLPSMCTPIRMIDSSSRLSIVKKDFGSSSSQIEITTLQHVYARQEVVDFWIAGKILGVESLEEWYYVSCKKIGCNKKLETQNGQLYCDFSNATELSFDQNGEDLDSCHQLEGGRGMHAGTSAQNELTASPVVGKISHARTKPAINHHWEFNLFLLWKASDRKIVLIACHLYPSSSGTTVTVLMEAVVGSDSRIGECI
nr:replication protein A 70 kDa DNA-binding subunit B-like [Ipomoea batatas]